MRPGSDVVIVVVAVICVLFFLLLALIDVAFKGDRNGKTEVKGSLEPHRVIGIDGDNYVVLEVRYDALDGSRTITLVDQGTFEKRNRYNG